MSKAAESAELFIKSLAAKRDQIGSNVAHYHGGIVYIYPLAGVDAGRARKEFKISAPSTVAQMVVEHVNNPQLAPVYRKMLEQGNELVRFLIRHLLLEVPGARNRKAFVESLQSTKEPVLQTCSLVRLKYKYLGYSVSDDEREFYSGVVSDITEKLKLISGVEREHLKKKRLLADMRDRLRR